MLRRRSLLRILASILSWVPFGRLAAAHAVPGDDHAGRLSALADAVLPQEIGAEARARAVDLFAAWLREYRAGAQLDHGYGITRLRRAPSSPAGRYRAQLDDLDRRAGGTFAAASLAERRRAVSEAVMANDIRTLPERPDGGHVATDLMAHFFNGPEATDLAYGRLIGRFSCRGLPGSDQRPPALQDPAPVP
jgi:hypothetical protein